MSQEDDFRLVGLANCYGTGTRSFNRSAEKREIDRQRKEATANYQHQPVILPLICRCRSFDKPHRIERHNELRSDYDWRLESERRNFQPTPVHHPEE